MSFVFVSLFIVLMAIAAIQDILSYTISNWISLMAALVFCVFAVLTRMPLENLIMHFATGAIVLVFGFVLFAMGVFGGGDAKLFAAASMWFAWPGVLSFAFYTAVAGGVLAVVILLGRQIQFKTPPKYIGHLLNKQAGIPYGVALFVGAVLEIINKKQGITIYG